MRLKHLIPCLLAAALLLACLAGCGGTAAPAGTGADALTVVATIFPLYDWARQLTRGADDIDVTLLMDGGVDMHSYQPSAADIVRLSSCDLFLYVGGASDEWVEDALREAVNPDMVVVDLLDVLGAQAKTEEVTEGMQAEEEEDAEYDEHVWLSPKNARLFCAAIADALCALDPENEALYRGVLTDYDGELAALDAAYEASVDGAARDTLLFADRFPFRYLTDDYGLRYYAAFPGCEAETEASFETVAFLARKLDELALPCVIVLEGSDGRLAETVIQNTSAKDQRILTLDSMQSTTAEDIAAGATYLGIMENDLAVLAAALQ